MHTLSRYVTRTLMAASLSAVAVTPASAEIVGAVEYYHVGFEHYFVTSNADEIAALDTGAGGWFRTGQRYRIDSEAGPGLSPVCRFYSEAFGLMASHFFTASADECEQVKANPHWTYEGVPFNAAGPDAAGGCAAGSAPVLRVYNNGLGGAPNHAYVTDVRKRELLLAAGWVAEGVAFCVPLAPGDPVAKTALLAATTWELPDIVHTAVIRTTFQAEVAADGRYDGLFVGGSAPPAVIVHSTPSGAWGGLGGWMPLSGTYSMAGGNGFEYWPYVGAAWEFDSAQGPSSPVCSMLIKENVDARYPRSQHPFQSQVLTGCTPGVVNRLGVGAPS